MMFLLQVNQSFAELGNDFATVTIVDSDGGKMLESYLGPSVL